MRSRGAARVAVSMRAARVAVSMRAARVAVSMRAALALPSVVASDPDLLLRSLEIYETDRVSFADGYLAALAEATGVGRVLSFDRGIDAIAGVERVEP
ncbi:MAG: type II toxin-antitoxin system VapC family toxin [Actinobacteria bacterium]|nr:type II toxin-antitoxin system VapC family toxin [Actinomycetota bacterium]